MKKTIIILLTAILVLSCQPAHSQPEIFVPNQPVGTPQGIKPGRVTFIRDTRVAKWDGRTGRWWDEENIDQEALDEMYRKSICALTGQKDIRKAWRKLIEYHNLTVNGKKAGYQKGELIAIKINLNNTFEVDDRDNEIDQSPQALRSLLRQLVRNAGVEEKDIIVYDATESWRRRNIPDRLRQPLHAEFPGVRWMSCNGSPGVEAADWQPDAIQFTSPDVRLGNELPRAVLQARYIINSGLLKGHEMTGQTICAKNHFGTVRWPNRQHGTPTVNQSEAQPGDYSALVDIMGCPNLGRKTILYLADGIYGMQTNVGAPQPERDTWDDLFGGGWSSCYLMSLDPVALESVTLDLLYAEFGNRLGASNPGMKTSAPNSDNYLRQAALGRNEKLGEYRPNGHPTGSLGVHEHWNNAKERRYTKIDFHVIK